MGQRQSASLKGTLILRLYEKDGSLVSERRIPMRSFVFGWVVVLQNQFTNIQSTVQVKDTGGTLRNLNVNSLKVNAAAADATFGIQVGTGIVAPAPSDFKLGTQIAQGSGVGQLQYGGQSVGAPTSTATQVIIALTRPFTNSSGSPIVITEVDLVSNDNSSFHIMLIRDLVSPGQQINNGQTLTATYQLAATT